MTHRRLEWAGESTKVDGSAEHLGGAAEPESALVGSGGAGKGVRVGAGGPAASAFEPVALPSADPEPKAKAEPGSTQKKVALVEPPAAESPKPEAKAKTIQVKGKATEQLTPGATQQTEETEAREPEMIG